MLSVCIFLFLFLLITMILVNPRSGNSSNPKETNSKESDFSDNEDNFWHKLTDGELYIDIDLYTACAIGNFEYVKQFIQNAKTYETDIINKSNNSGWTPLMYVCYVGNDEITKLLIREGADVFFEQDKNGRTPLMLAASSGNITLVKRLVENNARVNRVDKNGQTALFHAAEHGQTNIVKYLLSVDADVLIRQNGTGYTPFMEAARQGHEGVFSAFLDYGIDLNLKCNEGKTARGLAENCGSGSHVILNMIDNHYLKFPSLRYEADLSDFGMEEIKQPIQKVNEWLNDHSRDHSFDDISTNKLFKIIGSRSGPEIQSHAIAISSRYNTYSVEESFGKSAGDSTIVDSDRTPVGTPVDSILQQYMAHDMATTRTRYEFPTLEVFLKDLGLEKHLKLLEDESIDFSVLLYLTEDDFKELDMKFGPRKKIRTAVEEWKKETGWSRDGNYTFIPAIDNLKRKLADAYSDLQDVSADLAREKEARALLEAEQMEGRARISHTYFIAEKVVRACKELQSTNKTLKKHIETLKTVANENKKENLKSRLRELHNEMSEDITNTDNITETILRRVQKVLCDDVTELSSSSESPESSCTSYGTGGSVQE